MRNLKKRILSFISAVVMVATLLPTTALFASAADADTTTDGWTLIKEFGPYHGSSHKDIEHTLDYGDVSGYTDVKFVATYTEVKDFKVLWNKGGDTNVNSINGTGTGAYGFDSYDLTQTSMKVKFGSDQADQIDITIRFYGKGGSTTPDSSSVPDESSAVAGSEVTETIWTGNVTTSNWDAGEGDRELSFGDKLDGFTSISKIEFVLESGSQFQLNWGKSPFSDTVSVSTPCTYAVTDATQIQYIVTNKGIPVNGDNIKVTAVKVTGVKSGESSSTPDESSSTPDESSKVETNEVVIGEISNSFTLNWDSNDYIEFDLSKYESARVIVEVSNGNWFQVRAETSDGTSTNLHEGNYDGTYEYTFTADDMAKYTGGSKLYFKGNSGTVTSAKIVGVKKASTDESSTTDDSSVVDPASGNYNVSVVPSSTAGGTIGDFEAGSYAPGTIITLPTATANSGYKFVGWRDAKGNEPVDGTYTLPEEESTAKTENVVYTAVFEKEISNARDLPIINVTTVNQSYDLDNLQVSDKELSVDSWVTISNTTGSTAIAADGLVAEIRGRGNSTWEVGVNSHKYPFRLKFKNKTQLLDGTTKNKKWILLSNTIDYSLLRNQIALKFSNEYLTNIPYTPDFQQFEVYVDGEYQGVYFVCEDKEQASGRVDITVPDEDGEYDSTWNPSDAELSFLIEIDADAAKNNEDYYFNAYNHNGKQKYYAVKAGAVSNPDVTSATQTDANNVYVSAIKNYMDRVNTAIESGDEDAIRELIDVPSFVDMYILQELAKNPDVGAASFYYTKDVNGKLMASPPWDFDRGFGNEVRGEYYTGLNVATGSNDNNENGGTNDNAHKWYMALLKDKDGWFTKEVKARFTKLYNSGAFDAISTDFDWNAWKNSDAVAANWSEAAMIKETSYSITNKPDYYGKINAKGSYDNEVDYLSDWITNRIAVLKDAYYDTSYAYNLILNADDYADYTYTDLDAQQIAIPFEVKDTTSPVKVTINYTGDDKWVNVFTPGATLSGFGGSENSSAFSDITTKHYVQTTGSFSFIIPAGAPTGIYYAGVTAPDTFTSVKVEYSVKDAVKALGASSSTCTVTTKAKPSYAGTVTAGGSYEVGESVTVTASANSGYKFVNWTDEDGTNVSTNAAYTFDAETITLTANFTENLEDGWEVVKTLENVPFTPDWGTSNTLAYGDVSAYDTVKIVVYGDVNQFKCWLEEEAGNGVDIAGEGTWTDGVFEYTFADEHMDTVRAVLQGNSGTITKATVYGHLNTTERVKINVAASPAKGGTVTGAGKYELDDTVTLTATANTGYRFTGWTLDGAESETEASFDITVTSEMLEEGEYTYIANFEETPDVYTITASSEDETKGTVSPATQEIESTGTANAKVVATPNEGYEFVGWYYNGIKVSSSASYTFEVSKNVSLVAKFKVTNNDDTKSNTMTIEVEDYPSNTSTGATIEPSDTEDGFSGDGYLSTGKITDGEKSFVYVPFTAPAAGTYEFEVQYMGSNIYIDTYTTDDSTNYGTIEYDGVTYYQNDYSPAGDASNWTTHTVSVTLEEGQTCLIGMTSNDSSGKFDKVDVYADGYVFDSTETSKVLVDVETYPGKAGVVVLDNGDDNPYDNKLVSFGTVANNKKILALPRGAYKFVNWVDQNGEVISEEASLDLSTLTDVTKVTAKFELTDKSYVYVEAEDYIDLISEDGPRANNSDDLTVIEMQNDTGSNPATYATEKTGTIPFSNGQAVRMFGDSKAIAVPFTIPENNEETQIFVGYNYGNLSDTKTQYDGYVARSGLWLNIYIPKGANADPDAWTQFDHGTKALVHPVDPFMEDQFEGVFVIHIADDSVLQEIAITIPANAGAGQYFISVANDQDILSDSWSSVGEGQETGYFDYIMLKQNKSEDTSTEITFGANFYFTDMFGNTLGNNEFTQIETVKSEEDASKLEIYFSPKVPRYLWTQGYDIVAWEVYEGSTADSSKYVETITNTNYTEGEDYNDDTNSNASTNAMAQLIESKKYISGSSMTFKAIYAVAKKPYNATVSGGDMYIMEDANDTEYSYKVDTSEAFVVPNFGSVKLVAAETNELGETFSHWEVNGFIYTYESTFYFSVWTDVSFTAVYDTPEVKPVAYIDTNVLPSGFETEDTAYHKITYLCGFYVPENYTIVEFGIIYTNNGGLAKLNAVPDHSTDASVVWQVPTGCVDFILSDDQRDANGQSMVSLYGSKTGVTRYAKSYIIYKDADNLEHIVYSSNTAGIKNVGVTGEEETNINYDDVE